MASKKRMGDIVELLGVTPNTVRNYLSIGSAYYSPQATQRTGKRFTQWDIDQLVRFQSLLGQGLTYEQARDKLEPWPEIITPNNAPFDSGQEPQEQPAQIAPLEYFEQLQRLLEQQAAQHAQTIEAQNKLIQELQADKSWLQEQLEQAQRPWYFRILKR